MKAEELVAWRKSLGYTQTKFAELLGVPMRSVQNWENEVHKVPNLMVSLKDYIDRWANLKQELREKDREIDALKKQLR